jgi:hypothetical protein
MENHTIAEVFARLAVLEGVTDAVGTDFLEYALFMAKVSAGDIIRIKTIIKVRGEGD